MAKPEELIIREFPRLISESFRVTSPQTRSYNCIAWAAGVHDKWYWPIPDGFNFWPLAFPKSDDIAAFINLFESQGYYTCSSSSYERDYEKVAIFERNGKPTHAARQLDNDLWTSKLGSSYDIEHTLEGLEGDIYGQATIFMRREKS